MTKILALVMGCEVLPGVKPGQYKLGPRVIQRLQKGLDLQRNNKSCSLVVAPPKCPRYQNMIHTAAELMSDWLHLHDSHDIVLLCGKTFDTRGEVGAFWDHVRDEQDSSRLIIISSAMHCRRIRLLLKREFPQLLQRIEFLEMAEEIPRFERLVLEPLKCLSLYCPPLLQRWGKQIMAHLTGGNVSWRD
jgi:hypothetical protein